MRDPCTKKFVSRDLSLVDRVRSKKMHGGPHHIALTMIKRGGLNTMGPPTSVKQRRQVCIPSPLKLHILTYLLKPQIQKKQNRDSCQLSRTTQVTAIRRDPASFTISTMT